MSRVQFSIKSQHQISVSRRATMGRYFSVGAGFLLLLSFAFAGETLRQSDPPSGSTLRAWPQAVTLNFTSAIEPHRSQFRAYRLETNARDPQIIKAAALALSSRAFRGQGGRVQTRG
ncbi:MAG: hypothetical protein HC933_22975 [Pleurocapsa sp. SU_196_0]|nr:hypothetical protein [Pleurocapsa sp. SU_196_0]